MLPNDPAADPEVERVARILARGRDDDQDPDAPGRDGEPRWREFVDMAVSAIRANRTLRS